MTDSILNSTKKVLGIAPEYKAFDEDILMHLNTVFANLTQLGVGPEESIYVESDEEKWDLITEGRTTLNNVKTYVYLRVRLLFDPPTTSYALTSMGEQVKEHEWRLSAEGERLRRR